MAVTRPLEDVSSLLRAELKETWKRCRRLCLFELRLLQKGYRKEIRASTGGVRRSIRQKRCRLAVLEAVEVWRREEEREAPSWQKSPLVHLQVLRRRLREHGLIEKGLTEEGSTEGGLTADERAGAEPAAERAPAARLRGVERASGEEG